jgi:hypothetical protein
VATDLDASDRVCPPLELNPCHRRTPLQLDPPSVPHSGRALREQEAWADKTFSPSLTARCVVSKELRSIRRNDAPNMMGRCAWSMLRVSLTVAPAPYAAPVKDMARPRKNLVVSALSCIHYRRGCQKSIHLPALLLLIPSCGVIGHALSLVTPGSVGCEATWSPWTLHPFRHLPRRLLRSHALSERIGA